MSSTDKDVKAKFVDLLDISLSQDPMNEQYIRVFDLKEWLKQKVACWLAAGNDVHACAADDLLQELSL
jgi:hypothetical protein